jgi:hypothetical protein
VGLHVGNKFGQGIGEAGHDKSGGLDNFNAHGPRVA